MNSLKNFGSVLHEWSDAVVYAATEMRLSLLVHSRVNRPDSMHGALQCENERRYVICFVSLTPFLFHRLTPSLGKSSQRCSSTTSRVMFSKPTTSSLRTSLGERGTASASCKVSGDFQSNDRSNSRSSLAARFLVLK